MQAPTKHTFNTIWKLIFNKKIKLIVMLCNLFEDTRIKCDQYWPSSDSDMDLTDYIVKLQSIEELFSSKIVERKILITSKSTGNEFECSHLHVTCWPDHSIPENDVFKLLSIINTKIDYSLKGMQSPHVIVHCSAGIGRTGTMIALYTLYDILSRQYNQIQKLQSEDTESESKLFFSVFTIVRKLREQRYFSVSDQCQYKLLYQYAYDWIQVNCLKK